MRVIDFPKSIAEDTEKRRPYSLRSNALPRRQPVSHAQPKKSWLPANYLD